MKQQNLNLVAQEQVSAAWNNSDSTSWDSQLVYRELADVPVQMVDPVEELNRSVAALEDLQARMRFMMREIRLQLRAGR